MAQRGKKVGKKKVERWNDPPRRGNPFGLVFIAVGAAGLIYAACAPKVKHAAVSVPPPAQSAPVTPRARYEPPRNAGVASAPAAPRVKERETREIEKAVDVPRPARRRSPVVDAPGEAEATPAPTVIEESPVALPTAPRAIAEPPAPSPPKPAKKKQPALVVPTRPAKPASPAARRPKSPVGEFAANPASTGEVALTFDGCYDDKPLSDILSALDHRGYHATFFIAGMFADRFPTSVRRISDAGMELGNHSWSHPAFTKLSDADISRQLTRTNDLIHKITGKSPTLFRPPFGARDTRVRRLVSNEGFATVYWALDSWDSVKKGITAKEVSDRVLSRVQPGDVVLMHIGSRATADALPAILQGLDARGLRVVPVSKLMP